MANKEGLNYNSCKYLKIQTMIVVDFKEIVINSFFWKSRKRHDFTKIGQ